MTAVPAGAGRVANAGTGPARIIAVCGKGGVGKTAFTALLLRALLEEEIGDILAIDADPALGLAMALGVSTERTIGEVRERVIRAAMAPEPGPRQELARELDYLLLASLVETDRFAFLAMGRSEALGCFCPVNDLLRDGIGVLGRQYGTILVDGEAGVEQINRHVLPTVDALVLLTDGSARGERTVALAAQIATDEGIVGHDRIGVVVNRLPAGVAQPDGPVAGLPLLGVVPFDPVVAEFDAAGRPLLAVPGGSLAGDAVARVARALMR